MRRNRRVRFWVLPVLAALLPLAGGCSIRGMVINRAVDMMETGIQAFEADDDLDMLEKAFPANLKLLEAMLANDPKNTRLLVILARLYGSYTFTFLDGTLEEAMLSGVVIGERHPALMATRDKAVRYYRKAAEFALEALEIRHPGGRAQLQAVATADAFFQRMGPRDVPALFWYGFNRGADINLNRSSIAALSEAHLVQKAMETVVALDPTYFHGGAHLFLLSYYARPPMLGGNPELARSHYEALRKIAGDDFLPAEVYYARFYLQQQQDRAGFETRLQRIAATRIEASPYRLLNTVAIRRAAVYLDLMDRMFEDAP
jgi:hypothetical protein